MINNLALEASAGSGKTYALSVRYISLLFLGSRPERILTLTFTNKAALEMKKRIFDTLKNLEKSDELVDICRLTKKDKDEILSKAPKILTVFLKSDLKISTIDSFFSSILRKFSFNIGLMPDFSLEDSLVNDDVIERFLKISKQDMLYESLVLLALNETKKLSDLFSLFSVLFEKHSEINFKSLAKKSCAYPKEAEILDIVNLIKEKFTKNGLGESALKTLDVSSVKELLDKKFIQREDFEYWSYKKYSDDELNSLHVRLKEKLYLYAKAKESYVFSQFAKLYDTFLRALAIESKKKSTLSFSQMTNRLYDLLQDEIDKDFLYFRIDGSFSHMLIDEFQDTNIVQYKILEPFMDEIVSGVGAKEDRSLFIVGDSKQSIYRFRGGAKELFSYATDLLNLDVGVLGTNYRSSYNIVNFVNNTFDKKIENYKNQEVKKGAIRGFVGVFIDDDIAKNMIANISNLLSLGVVQEDIAVLCHTNQEALLLKELIEAEITQAKVTMEAKRKLINIPIIAAIIDFIHYLYFKDELYLENFQTLSAKEYKIESFSFDTSGSVADLIVDIIKHFDIFYLKDDLLLFAQSCMNFLDIEDFLFNYKDMSQSSIAKGSEGIRVLTIHKSKGLEFSNVFLIDRLKRGRSGGGTFIFDYDDIQLQNLFLKIKSREFFDESYRKAKEKESLKELEDTLNTQYVAFTRARDNLFVLCSQKSSSFKNLELVQFQSGEIYVPQYEEKSINIETKYFVPKKYGTQEIEIAEINKSEDNDFKSQDFGLALHYMLEIMGDFDEKYISNAYESLRNRYKMILDEEDLIDIKKRVLRLLEDKEFMSIVKDAILLKEQPIYFDGQRKQLDLLVVFEDKVVVIDYKSSQEKQSSHVKQVLHYKRALEAIYGKKCEAYLCYMKKEKNEMIKIGE
jgi:ATP-dependent exoDNAse (exonuclease V) beta subunit